MSEVETVDFSVAVDAGKIIAALYQAAMVAEGINPEVIGSVVSRTVELGAKLSDQLTDA